MRELIRPEFNASQRAYLQEALGRYKAEQQLSDDAIAAAIQEIIDQPKSGLSRRSISGFLKTGKLKQTNIFLVYLYLIKNQAIDIQILDGRKSILEANSHFLKNSLNIPDSAEIRTIYEKSANKEFKYNDSQYYFRLEQNNIKFVQNYKHCFEKIFCLLVFDKDKDYLCGIALPIAHQDWTEFKVLNFEDNKLLTFSINLRKISLVFNNNDVKKLDMNSELASVDWTFGKNPDTGELEVCDLDGNVLPDPTTRKSGELTDYAETERYKSLDFEGDDLGELLCHACRAADLERINKLIERGADVNHISLFFKRPPVHIAVIGGLFDIAERLCQTRKVDYYARNRMESYYNAFDLPYEGIEEFMRKMEKKYPMKRNWFKFLSL